MKAISGYLENGRFTPIEVISLPKRVQAVLVYNDTVADENREARLSWLRKFHSSVKQSTSEEMPEFPRVHFDRKCMNLSDEG